MSTPPIVVRSWNNPLLGIFGFGRSWLWFCRIKSCPVRARKSPGLEQIEATQPAALAAGLAHLKTHTET